MRNEINSERNEKDIAKKMKINRKKDRAKKCKMKLKSKVKQRTD